MLPTYFVMLSRTMARFKRGKKRISIVLIRGKTRTGTSKGMLWGRFGVCLVFLAENWRWGQWKACSGMPLSRLSSQGSVPQGHRIVVSVRADSDASPTWRAEVGSDVDRGDNCRQENIFIVREGGVGRPTSGSKYSISQASIPLAFLKCDLWTAALDKKGRNQK